MVPFGVGAGWEWVKRKIWFWTFANMRIFRLYTQFFVSHEMKNISYIEEERIKKGQLWEVTDVVKVVSLSSQARENK